MLINLADFNHLYDIIYLYTALLVIISAISLEIRRNNIIEFKQGRFFVFLPMVFLIFLVGLRDYNVGSDTGSYYEILWKSKPEINFGNEFLFPVIAIILKKFNASYTIFLLLVAFLFFIFIYKCLLNYAKIYQANLLMCFFCFMSFFFLTSMSVNIIRQGVSLAILLYAFSLYEKKDSYLKILFFLIMALFFHLTSVIPIIIYFLVYVISNKYRNYIYLLLFIYTICLAASYFNIGLLNIFPFLDNLLGHERRVGYLSGDDYGYVVGFKTQFALFNTLFLCIFLYIYKKINNVTLKNNYLILIGYFMLTSALLFLTFQLPYSDRWGLFSWVTIPLLMVPVFYSPYLNGGIKIHFIFILLLIFIGFKFYGN